MKNDKKETFQITVCRTGYSFKTLEIEAGNIEEAEKIALDDGGDYEYSEKTAEYSIV